MVVLAKVEWGVRIDETGDFVSDQCGEVGSRGVGCLRGCWRGMSGSVGRWGVDEEVVVVVVRLGGGCGDAGGTCGVDGGGGASFVILSRGRMQRVEVLVLVVVVVGVGGVVVVMGVGGEERGGGGGGGGGDLDQGRGLSRHPRTLPFPAGNNWVGDRVLEGGVVGGWGGEAAMEGFEEFPA